MKPTKYTKIRAGVLFALWCVITKFRYDRYTQFEAGELKHFDDFVPFMVIYEVLGKWGVLVAYLVVGAVVSYGTMFLSATRNRPQQGMDRQ
jgi:hypothetical protein